MWVREASEQLQIVFMDCGQGLQDEWRSFRKA